MAFIDKSKVTDQVGFTLNGKPIAPGGNTQTDAKPKPIIKPAPTPPARPSNPNVINVRVG